LTAHFKSDKGAQYHRILQSHWNSPNKDATNNFGFTALPGGERDYTGSFRSLGIYANWYTGTINSANLYELSCYNGLFAVSGTSREYGFSVRCIKE
jgi:uncharacterized protein (TIGR02145 family)